MAKSDYMQVATAGEHYVAFRLAQLGHVVAIPRGGSPAVDLLVSNRQGSRSVALQVKTTEWACRERGRGNAKKLHHLEFPLGPKAAASSDGLLFVFVDLCGREPTSSPVVYVVPPKVIRAYCAAVGEVPFLRWHPLVEHAEPHRERWDLITDELG